MNGEKELRIKKGAKRWEQREVRINMIYEGPFEKKEKERRTHLKARET